MVLKRLTNNLVLRSIAVFSLIFTLVMSPAPAQAEEKRLALLIGVADYSHIKKLANTVNDTRLLARVLEDLDFEVILVENPNLASLREKIRKFAFQAETADVALTYYAGHGIEFGGINYLIPSDINVNDRAGIVENSVSLDEILLAVDKARQMRVVILDSCRNDPFVSEDTTQAKISLQDASIRRAGLAPASPERGTLVAYAAEAGQVALDGAGENSPFASALAKHLGTPDLEIGLVFRRIRDSVLSATANKQEPHTYGSLPGKPYFLAGVNQSANQLENDERRNAWAKLGHDQEQLLVTLADEGDARAAKGLAYRRLNPEDKNYDPEQAVSLLDGIAKRGDAEAQYELGRLYELGVVVDRDVKKALDLYRRAAKADYAPAINDLGFLHYSGSEEVIQDHKLAIDYFGRAADLRHPEAMFNYAALIDDEIVRGKAADDAAKYLYDALRSGSAEVLKQLLENPKMFKKSTRTALQQHLAEVNLYDGKLDGDIGPGTKAGMKRAYGLNE